MQCGFASEVLTLPRFSIPRKTARPELLMPTYRNARTFSTVPYKSRVQRCSVSLSARNRPSNNRKRYRSDDLVDIDSIVADVLSRSPLQVPKNVSTPTVIGVSALALFALVSLISTILHITASIAFFGLAFLAVPILMTTAASIGVIMIVAIPMLATGLFIFSGPLFALGALIQVGIPLAVGYFVLSKLNPKLAGSISDAASRIFSAASKRATAGQSGVADSDAELLVDNFGFVRSNDDIELARFDQQLRERSKRPKSVQLWSPQDLAEEMTLVGLGKFARRFEEERIDGAVAVTLTERDIRSEFGSELTLGERKRIMMFLNSLKT
eukprot:CAMPEP_0182444820 /NCGR_PEP_ID=MMETSP1172-20130603/3147_1 /TAXON_ID=708627 /ORGANISM="Timspurckia oligopyrenoides, Strain CCMP3278" /LENGTH=325 /DNA_ID=CAMNT_0024640461 /DNA_START=153 /DNA_END=1130 /DNA_ORIENTATION=-